MTGAAITGEGMRRVARKMQMCYLVRIPEWNFVGNWPKSYYTTHWMSLRKFHRLWWLLDGVPTQFMP